MVAQTRTGGNASPGKLKFHEKLVGGKSQTTDALQKKLKALHSELAQMDQEQVDTNSLSSVRKELINTSILLHKDRGVKAYAACCLADLLRLYAPDAPYIQAELRDIFHFFFRQLSTGLKGPDCPYYNEYFHLLESLSTVKSVVLVCDLPGSDDLMEEIFRSFFAMVRLNLAKKIELFMADILVAILEECQSLPPRVLKILLAQFLDKDTGMDQPAYRLAVQVCSQIADRLQRHVCQYFTDLFLTHADDEELDEMEKAHNLIKRLNRSCPALLHNVVPLLEEELKTPKLQLRIMATHTLGEMYADKSGSDFIKKYPTTWVAWLAKGNDGTPAVRLAFMEAVKGVLENIVEQRDQLEDLLSDKLCDPDERVRAALCRTFSQLDYETALHHVSGKLLQGVAGRCIDKKSSVQSEAMKAIGRLYSLAYPEIEAGDPAAIQKFSWIPNSLLNTAYMSQEVKAAAEVALAEYIFPLPATPNTPKATEIDEASWTDKLLHTMKYLNPRAVGLLLTLSGIKNARPSAYERYFQSCIANNGGIIDENEEKVVARLTFDIKRVASTFPDPQKAAEDLATFAKMNESRLYKLLKICMDPQTDVKALVKASSEFLRRVEQSSSTIFPTMTFFLRRASLQIVNQSSILTFIKRLQQSSEGGASAENAKFAQTWLVHISKHFPALYQQHVGELSKAIADEKNEVLVEVCLQAMSAVADYDPKFAPNDKRTLERVMRFVMDSNYRQAKFASRMLTRANNKDDVCGEIVEAIAEALPEVGINHLVAHLAVLAQFTLRVPDAFEQRSDVIMSFLVKNVLMAPSVPSQENMDTDQEWVEDEDMSSQLRAKILALKTCRNRCLAHGGLDTALDIAQPVLKMFTTILQHSGSLTPDAEDDPPTKSRLRLQAAISLLHLATVEAYRQAVDSHFVLIAITIQDPCYQVRIAFLTKLIMLLSAQKLDGKYNVIPFLAIHDPEADVITRAKAYITHVSRILPKQLRLKDLEMLFIRLLHLLAHHPDFAISHEALPDIAKYIDFYLDLICTQENISLLYHLAVKAKTVRDAESHTYSENLYAACDLAQHLIKICAKSHGWALESYPGKVRMPGDIFRPPATAEAAKEIFARNYLPEETLQWLKEKKQRSEAKERHDKKPKAERKPKSKPVAVAKTNGALKKPQSKKRKRKMDESEEEESSSSEEDDVENDEDMDDNAKSPVREESGSESEESADEREEKHRRSARTRAKARIKQQAKKPKK